MTKIDKAQVLTRKSIRLMFICSFTLLLFTQCSRKNGSSLEHLWYTTGPFESPESIIYDEARNLIYVSNGKGYAKNGHGFISKLSAKGEIIKLKWIEGLNRPTGMAIKNNTLYVADIDVLRAINIDKGELSRDYQLADANPGLNDVTINHRQEVYVTASNINGVCQLRGDTLILIHQDAKLLEYANGITGKGDQLFVGGMQLSTIDLTTGVITTANMLNQDIEDFEGLAVDSDLMICTLVKEQGVVALLYPNGQSEIIFNSPNYLADFDLAQIAGTKTLLIATGNHQSNEYGVLALSMVN